MCVASTRFTRTIRWTWKMNPNWSTQKNSQDSESKREMPEIPSLVTTTSCGGTGTCAFGPTRKLPTSGSKTTSSMSISIPSHGDRLLTPVTGMVWFIPRWEARPKLRLVLPDAPASEMIINCPPRQSHSRSNSSKMAYLRLIPGTFSDRFMTPKC